MSRLRIFQGELKKEITFEKESSPLLAELLSLHHTGPDHPCGGRGICKKCAVTVRESAAAEISSSDRISPDNSVPGELREVLSCQYRLSGDCDVYLPEKEERWAIEETASESASVSSVRAQTGLGAAVDIGTTTVVLNLYDLADGALLSTASAPNPQRSIAADVMGRIQAAMEGKLHEMQQMITEEIRCLLSEALQKAGIDKNEVFDGTEGLEETEGCDKTEGSDETGRLFPSCLSSAVVTGNTTMLCLLTGTDPSPMAKAPFPMADSFGKDWNCVYLPRCMHAFVGADITCAVLSSGLTEGGDTVLLADIGTNGELALWNGGKLSVTSTAAGPAFEGAGITMGCGSIEGAIDHVEICHGLPVVHTIGGKKAVGLCGSGLIDAVAAGLSIGLISETGVLEEPFVLTDGVALYPEDVRSLQLAKAAVCAGIRTLLDVSGTDFDEVKHLYIAGGFGSHINVEAAGIIGLIPEELTRIAVPLGNAALAGAAGLLLQPEQRAKEKRIADRSEHVNLGGNPLFNDYYMDCMLFGEE